MTEEHSRIWTGSSGGLLAGLIAGCVEALVVLSQSNTGEYRALLIGAILYSMLGLPLGLLVGLLAEISRRLKGPHPGPGLLWTLSFVFTGAVLGQGILEALRPLLLPISPLVEAWWLSAAVIANLAVACLGFWLGPIFVERTPLRRVLRPRRTLTLYGALLLFAALFSAAPGELSSPGDLAPKRPVAMAPDASKDVILILVDGLRADHLGSYGSTSGLSPSLDSLALESIRFERVVASAPHTGPALATIMTGMLPTAHGCTRPGCRLSEGLTTMAEVLREHGYATSMVANHPDLFDLGGFDQGFDYYAESLPDPFLEGSWSADRLVWMGRVIRLMERNRQAPREVRHYYRSADLVLGELAQMVGSNRDRGNRFIAVAHLMETHSPFFEWEGEAITGRSQGPNWTQEGEGGEFEAIRALYAHEVVAVDREIGRFIEWMESEEGLENTVLIVAGIQGQSLGEHGLLWEGASVYDEAVQVPLIMRLPKGEFAGSEVPWQVRLLDLAPTLGVLAGATNPVSWQGFDLLDGRARDGIRGELEEGEGSLDRPAITELDLENGRLQALRSADWTYIRGCGPESPLDRGRSGCAPSKEIQVEELYRRDLDPDQATNLLGQQGQLQSELSGTLREALEDAERVAQARAELMEAISGCEDCQAMEAQGRILDCRAFCGED